MLVITNDNARLGQQNTALEVRYKGLVYVSCSWKKNSIDGELCAQMSVNCILYMCMMKLRVELSIENRESRVLS